MDYRLRQEIDRKLHAETGTRFKAARGKISVVLIYPNTYYVGMSNLGFQSIYGFLNDYEDIFCERAFLPEPDVLTRYVSTGTPLCSYESRTAVSEFDIVAFSVSFENDYLNILRILDIARIPLKAEERKTCTPLVILGGAVTTINPEPLAMFFDLCIIGDGEDVFADMLQTYRDAVGSQSKRTLLARLAHTPGVYVPSLYDIVYHHSGRVKRIHANAPAPETVTPRPILDLDRHPAYSRILTDSTEFGQMFLLQVNRGCCYSCRFCHTGYTQKPLRHLSRETALHLVRQGVQKRQKIGLVGAAIAEYPHLHALCDAILSQGGTISASSLRISTLSHSPSLLEAVLRSGQKTVTLAPEAGTERLRNMLRKPLPDSLLYDMVDRLSQELVLNLKLYFLVGVPTETEEDLDGIIEMCRQCRQHMLKPAQKRGRMGTITVSVNPFVPKPFTPLQWCAMETETQIKRKLQRIKRGLARIGNIEVIHESPKGAVWQGILARGDRRLGQVLQLAYLYQGNWKKALRELSYSPQFFVHRCRECEETFPWRHLHVGLSYERLLDEYQQMKAQASRPPTGSGRDARAPIQRIREAYGTAEYLPE